MSAQIIPTGPREWAVIYNGRLMVTIANRIDADLLAAGLNAREQLGSIYKQLYDTQDLVEDLTQRLNAFGFQATDEKGE